MIDRRRLFLPRRRLVIAGPLGLVFMRAAPAHDGTGPVMATPSTSASDAAPAPASRTAPASGAASASRATAAPLGGPDFVVAKVDAWRGMPGAETELVLFDGSHWHLDPHAALYDAQRRFIGSAIDNDLELFVSGDRGTGVVERIAHARRLAVKSVREAEPDGRRAVQFQLLPAIYRLRMDVPDAQRNLELLQRSARDKAMPDQPDVLVGLDTVCSEILVVRPLERP